MLMEQRKKIVLVPRKNLDILKQTFKNELDIAFSANSWMNQDLTIQFVLKTFGQALFRNRLLIWDSFSPHIIEDTLNLLRRLKIIPAVVPGMHSL